MAKQLSYPFLRVIIMGTWGMANMTKLNEENLSKLSRQGLYAKLKERGLKSKGRIYTYKKATPEILETIRTKRAQEERIYLKRRNILLLSCGLLFIALMTLVFVL